MWLVLIRNFGLSLPHSNNDLKGALAPFLLTKKVFAYTIKQGDNMIFQRYYFKRIDSTNNYIKNHLTELDDGAIVVSDYQSSGRGRRGAKWDSLKGKNLTFSFLKRDTYDLTHHTLMQATLAVVLTLKKHGLDAKIKLPNDILVNKKKISGVLIERIHSNNIIYSIVGIGININQIFDEKSRTSVKMETNKSTQRSSLLKQFITIYNQITSENVFDVFKKNVIKPAEVKYKNNVYRWIDLDKNWHCTLSDNVNTLNVPITEVEFDYTLYL